MTDGLPLGASALSITSTFSVLGARVRGATDDGVASYRRFELTLGVGRGPVGSPRSFLASAINAASSSSVFPESTRRWK